MQILSLITEPLGLILGSLILAGLLCWLFWHLFAAGRHPRAGPLVLASAALVLILLGIPHSQLLKMALAFATTASLASAIAGIGSSSGSAPPPECGR